MESIICQGTIRFDRVSLRAHKNQFSSQADHTYLPLVVFSLLPSTLWLPAAKRAWLPLHGATAVGGGGCHQRRALRNVGTRYGVAHKRWRILFSAYLPSGLCVFNYREWRVSRFSLHPRIVLTVAPNASQFSISLPNVVPSRGTVMICYCVPNNLGMRWTWNEPAI